MKKSIYILSLALLSCIISCKKDDDLGPMQFKLTGLGDTMVYQGNSVQRSVKLFFLGGTEEEATLSVSGLPNGTTYTFGTPILGADATTSSIITSSATADTGYFPVTITATTEKGGVFSKTMQLHVSRPVNTAPVISLTGGTNYAWVLNAAYSEPGYQAGDQEDGNLTAQVTVTGTVNQDSVGLYYVSYVVSDSEGLKDSVVRVVNVKNSLDYLNGLYTVTTTNLSTMGTRNWITSISASVNTNKTFKIFKVSDLYPADCIVTYNSTKDSIFMAPQTFTITNGLGTVDHTLEGKGKILVQGSIIKVILTYTDSYIDPNTTLPVVLNLKDEYVHN
ncbi:MAG: DUF5011 domain-containing protein [Bacteroidia bacterium]